MYTLRTQKRLPSAPSSCLTPPQGPPGDRRDPASPLGDHLGTAYGPCVSGYWLAYAPAPLRPRGPLKQSCILTPPPQAPGKIPAPEARLVGEVAFIILTVVYTYSTGVVGSGLDYEGVAHLACGERGGGGDIKASSKAGGRHLIPGRDTF